MRYRAPDSVFSQNRILIHAFLHQKYIIKNARNIKVLIIQHTLPKYVSLDHRYEEQHVVEFNLLDAELLDVREERNLLRQEANHLKEETNHLKEETNHLKEETNVLKNRLKEVQAPSSDNTEVQEIEQHQKELLEQAEIERRALGRNRKFTAII